ncbi:MAG: ABC transporter permease [Hyphomicrobiaceae bacterium]|nr:MAG: ABC transporter permease [Hyphomicrobiaceae bacterium]
MQQEANPAPSARTHHDEARPNTMGAREDLIGGLRKYDLWGRLGWLEIKRRYRRTIMGPFWTCVSLMIFVIVIGSVGSGLLSKQTAEYLPFLVAGMIVWVTLQNTLIESVNVFVAGTGLIRQMNFEYSILVYSLVWRNFIVFAHNLLVYLLIFLIFSPEKLGFANLLAVPGLIVLAVNCAWLSLLLGMVSLRFRDLQQLVMSIVQVSMFVTPLFWPPEGLEGLRRIFFVGLNPLYHLLTIVRDPLLGGKLPPINSCIAVTVITILGWALTYALFAKFRKRIPYWL